MSKQDANVIKQSWRETHERWYSSTGLQSLIVSGDSSWLRGTDHIWLYVKSKMVELTRGKIIFPLTYAITLSLSLEAEFIQTHTQIHKTFSELANYCQPSVRVGWKCSVTCCTNIKGTACNVKPSSQNLALEALRSPSAQKAFLLLPHFLFPRIRTK